ncbi:MAG TPA: ATP-binding cassette domain-containing protein [Thermoanaerobaculia bacterium]|nr:ATP-binding cassette domain-containing protein [Thermoanaerobaculia bacterium]
MAAALQRAVITATDLAVDVRLNAIRTVRIVTSIDLVVHASEYTVLMGPSGTGKTTILRALCDCLSLSASVTGTAWRTDDVAVVWQRPALMPWRSALSNVLVEESLRSAKGSLADRAQLLFQHLYLRGIESKSPAELSAGMAQRVALARALAARPAAYLLDEPLSSVDVPQKEAIEIWLRDFVLGESSGVLHVTHDPYEAVFLADRIYVLGGTPATIQSTLTINAPRRNAAFRASAAFAAYVAQLRTLLPTP